MKRPGPTLDPSSQTRPVASVGGNACTAYAQVGELSLLDERATHVSAAGDFHLLDYGRVHGKYAFNANAETPAVITITGALRNSLLVALGNAVVIKPSEFTSASVLELMSLVEQAGTGATAEFGAYAFPDISGGVSQTGTRRFGITEVGVMYGDNTLATIPNTRALIVGAPMAPLGN